MINIAAIAELQGEKRSTPTYIPHAFTVLRLPKKLINAKNAVTLGQTLP